MICQISPSIEAAVARKIGSNPHTVLCPALLGEAPHWCYAPTWIICPRMKAYIRLMFALAVGIGSCLAAEAQEQTNEFLMTWNAAGYTTNAKGNIIATNLTQQTLIN